MEEAEKKAQANAKRAVKMGRDKLLLENGKEDEEKGRLKLLKQTADVDEEKIRASESSRPLQLHSWKHTLTKHDPPQSTTTTTRKTTEREGGATLTRRELFLATRAI